jgi:hypothetical protein
MDRLFADERQTNIDRSNSFVISYPHFIAYFNSKEIISVSDFIIGAHFAYGWMPTMLEIYTDNPDRDLQNGVAILNRVKNGEIITDNDFNFLIRVVNNSLVGTTKLLHFISPQVYGIWDSRVYSYFYQEKAYNYRVNKIENYREFLRKCDEIRGDTRFGEFHQSVNNKMGYDVSAVRAIEVIMFLNGEI